MAAASEVIIQAQTEPAAVPEQPKADGVNRLQKRFDKLTRTIHEWKEAAGKLAAEVSNLKLALAKSETERKETQEWLQRALSLVEYYSSQRPITPNLNRYNVKGAKSV
jgi:predicted  nucleic acid-binding Zn-ribbon protein